MNAGKGNCQKNPGNSMFCAQVYGDTAVGPNIHDIMVFLPNMEIRMRIKRKTSKNKNFGLCPCLY